MGAGAFNKVYKIDDFYILRINNWADNKKTFFKRPVYTFEEDLVSQLSCYYGNPKANFGDIQVLKNAIGDKDFVIAGTLINDNYFAQRDYFTNKYLPAFANLPQKAYNDLAKDIKILSDNYYCFDMSNPNNFIKVGEEIRVVDDITSLKSEFFFYTPMLYTLLSSGNLFSDLKPEDYKNMQTIIKKTVIAMQNANLDWNIEERSSRYSDALQAANLELNIKEIYAAVKDLKDEDKINKVLDELFSQK